MLPCIEDATIRARGANIVSRMFVNLQTGCEVIWRQQRTLEYLMYSDFYILFGFETKIQTTKSKFKQLKFNQIIIEITRISVEYFL